jgi:hypothetical protein
MLITSTCSCHHSGIFSFSCTYSRAVDTPPAATTNVDDHGRSEPEGGRALKVSIICDAVLAELLTQYSKTHTQSILTAHLSKIPPDIPSALRVIAQLKGIYLGNRLMKRWRLQSDSACH